MKNFVNLTGFTNIGSGILLLAFWYLYAILLPYGQLSTTLSLLVLDKDWTFINILGSLGALFGKLQVYPRSIGITALSVGLIWIGWLMRRM
jgi:hypothetical protein